MVNLIWQPNTLHVKSLKLASAVHISFLEEVSRMLLLLAPLDDPTRGDLDLPPIEADGLQRVQLFQLEELLQRAAVVQLDEAEEAAGDQEEHEKEVPRVVQARAVVLVLEVIVVDLRFEVGPLTRLLPFRQVLIVRELLSVVARDLLIIWFIVFKIVVEELVVQQAWRAERISPYKAAVFIRHASFIPSKGVNVEFPSLRL